MPENSNTYFDQIKERLNAFSRRYYLNALLQNAAIYLTSASLLLLFVSAIELFVKNDSTVRAVIFYAFLALSLAGLFYLVLLPAFKSLGLLRGLSDLELSVEVGKTAKEVDDKLLNILMLEGMNSTQQNDLIKAAIDQKSQKLSQVPFHLSASLKKGLKFVRYAGIFLLLLMLMGMTFPDLFNYGTKRLVFYNEDIKPPPPFVFELQNDLLAVKNETYVIQVKVNGDILPKELFVLRGEEKRKASKISQNEFRFGIQNITEDFAFRLAAESVFSEEYLVKVLQRPSISNFNLQVKYPAYLNKQGEEFKNTGNLNVPEGSQIFWNVGVESGEHLEFIFDNKGKQVPVENGMAHFDSLFKHSVNYRVSATNSNGLNSDSINYRIRLVKDQAPSIDVTNHADSLDQKEVLIGRISDDYGISSFRFVYKLSDADEYNYEQLKFDRRSNSSDFLYEIDWTSWDLKKGDEVSYFFEVWDNDGVNGSKVSRSRDMKYRVLDESEIEATKDALVEDIEDEMEEAIKEAKELRKDIEGVQKDMMDQKKLDWSSKKQIEDLLKRNEELKKTLNDINAKNQQKNKQENKLNHSDELNQKRDELERLMEEILDDKTLEKLKELEALMDKLNKEDLKEKMDEIELSNEQLENELDRSLELFKQLEFEMQLEKTMEGLEELKKEQEELRKETEGDKEAADKDKNSKSEEKSSKQEEREELAKKQDDLEKKFEEWEKELEELKEKNEKLENKHDVDEQASEREEVKEDMKKASEELKDGKKKNAAENQKEAEDKMDQMQDDLAALKSSMEAQAMEDLQSLRNTLENLIELSFEQEKIMEDMKGMRSDDPRFNETTREQRAILSGLEIVEDSLNALSKRITQIEPTINREVLSSKSNMTKSIRAMTERKTPEMQRRQQLAMTSLNNLALLLDEVVSQIQQQMMQSKGQCQKPGSSKPGSSSMKQMQQQLNKQIDAMKKMMENGKSQGPKSGEKSGDAESLAKMAAEQGKIREELRKMAEGANQKDGKGYKKIGEMMEETERDIVNRQISQETIMRQEKILTRLLEAENAERQQDMEETREAVTGVQKQNGNLLDVKEYYKSRYDNHEELIKQNISFRRYYNNKVEEYLKSIAQ